MIGREPFEAQPAFSTIAISPGGSDLMPVKPRLDNATDSLAAANIRPFLAQLIGRIPSGSRATNIRPIASRKAML